MQREDDYFPVNKIIIKFFNIKNMEQDVLNKLEEQDKKMDAIYVSVEKMRKYFLWTLIISILVIVLPLLGLIFIIPQFLDTLQLGL